MIMKFIDILCLSFPLPATTAVSADQSLRPSSALRIVTEGGLQRLQVGETLTLPCEIEGELGRSIILWKKGPRVLTAAHMLVRRDRRIALEGNSLIITGK